MTPVFSARRRAEEFDSLIERSSGADLTDARYAEFLEIVGALRATPPVEARPEFVSDLRGQLMLAAQTQLVPAEQARLQLPARRPRDRRIAAAVGGFAIVGATTSMAMAAQTALPGDVLYPLKRAIENVETSLSVNEGAKGATMLANASGRLDEVSELSREGGLDDTTAIAETLNTFTEQATAASDLLLSDYASTGDESSISDLRDFTSLSMETLSTLEDLVPAEARDELLHAARVLSQIDSEAQQACPDCGGVGITEIPKILATSSTFGGARRGRGPRQRRHRAGSGRQEGRRQEGPLDARGHRGRRATTRAPPSRPAACSTPTTATPTPPDGDGTADQPADDPIEDLTDGLVNGGGTQPTSSPSGLPGVPDVGRRDRRPRGRHRRAHQALTVVRAGDRSAEVSGRRTPAPSAGSRASAGSSRAPGR